MSRVVLIGALPESLINFRGNLLNALMAAGHMVTAMAGTDAPDVIQRLSAIGVDYRSYPVQRNGMNPAVDLQTLIALRKTLKKLRPDAVLSYTIKPVIWGGLALKGLPATRFYALITGLGFAFNKTDKPMRQILTAFVTCLYRFSLTRASRVIFQNPDNRDVFVLRKIITKDKCVIVNGSGVNINKFSLTPLPEGKNKIVFLTIGRLLGEKGFREYAEAARRIKVKYPETVFRLVGPEDPSPDRISQQEVQRWHDEGIIQYLGKTDDVRPFISDCHVYVLPSYHEGTPRTVLEAMAMGRPIITTNAPGCRETVKLVEGQTLDKDSIDVVQGENGFLVPIKNADKLANAMEMFIKKPDLVLKMGTKSRKIAEEKYDVHKVNHEILKAMGLSCE
ncbi:MAG: glycosyltransferase family 4 protein [Deltaproteobacteria bacterium]|nr:glycosyltransferase family 4 protein [Deltaproteobacteria bacterium]